MGVSPSTDNINKLRAIEDDNREIEHQDAIKARRNSRVRWLKLGEAPSKYFFSQLKAKHARESIPSLRLPSGEKTENEEQILQEMFRFYSDLFSEDPSTKCFDKERSAALSLITKKVNEQDNQIMARRVTAEEVRSVVFEMLKDKSPGIDGVTIEVLIKCWDFMGDSCFEMVSAFWNDGILTSKALAGVLKLIPTNQETLDLANCRPLTILTLTEKIVAKLISNRIKGYPDLLVDQQQTGFLKGRDIMDKFSLTGWRKSTLRWETNQLFF